MSDKPRQVHIGQIWMDTDPRSQRTLRVTKIFRVGLNDVVSVHCAETGRYSDIRADRLTNPKLYTFVREGEEPPKAHGDAGTWGRSRQNSEGI